MKKKQKILDLAVLLLQCVVCHDLTKTAHHTQTDFQPVSRLLTQEISQNLSRFKNKHGGLYAGRNCDDSVWNDFHRKFTEKRKGFAVATNQFHLTLCCAVTPFVMLLYSLSLLSDWILFRFT